MTFTGVLHTGKLACAGRPRHQLCVCPRAAIAEPPAVNRNGRSENGAAKPLHKEGPTVINGQVNTDLNPKLISCQCHCVYTLYTFDDVMINPESLQETMYTTRFPIHQTCLAISACVPALSNVARRLWQVLHAVQPCVDPAQHYK